MIDEGCGYARVMKLSCCSGNRHGSDLHADLGDVTKGYYSCLELVTKMCISAQTAASGLSWEFTSTHQHCTSTTILTSLIWGFFAGSLSDVAISWSLIESSSEASCVSSSMSCSKWMLDMVFVALQAARIGSQTGLVVWAELVACSELVAC